MTTADTFGFEEAADRGRARAAEAARRAAAEPARAEHARRCATQWLTDLHRQTRHIATEALRALARSGIEPRISVPLDTPPALDGLPRGRAWAVVDTARMNPHALDQGLDGTGLLLTTAGAWLDGRGVHDYYEERWYGSGDFAARTAFQQVTTVSPTPLVVSTDYTSTDSHSGEQYTLDPATGDTVRFLQSRTQTLGFPRDATTGPEGPGPAPDVVTWTGEYWSSSRDPVSGQRTWRLVDLIRCYLAGEPPYDPR